MDLFDIIITVLILGVGGLLGSKKRPGRESDSGKKNTAQGKQRPSFGSVLAEMLGEIDVANKPAAKPATEPSKIRRQEKTKQQTEYFTYENQPINWNEKNNSFSEEVSDSKSDIASEGLLEPLFDGKLDLRKAFIYQTILENKYITY